MNSKLENVYHLPVKEVEKLLEANLETGLSTQEANIRLEKFGRNVLDLHQKVSLFKIWLRQFNSPLVWVLLFAAGLAFAFGEHLEGIAVVIVILINAVIGFIMEWQANRSMESLRKLSEEKTVVIRDGEKKIIKASGLVVGDLVFLESGDVIPADCRLAEQNNLAVKEAALTGESMPVNKKILPLPENVPLADRNNCLFKGTIVTRGNATAIVSATGKNTELGLIAHLADTAIKEITPLEKKLEVLSQKLIGITIVLTIIIFFAGVLQGRSILLMVETAIALAIAAIPEGLPIVATIALAKGMLRLAKRNVIVKKLSSVETLGETQVIFTDKTGTLTENKMQADALVFNHKKYEKDDFPVLKTEHPVLFENLMRVAILCNNASLNHDGNSTGDPIEIALLELAHQENIEPENWRKRFPRIKEIPFDASTKMMGTLHKMPDGKFLVCIKGALEVLLKESDYTCIPDGKKSVGVEKTYWQNSANELAGNGLRVLAFAYSILETPEENFFRNLNFIACIAFLDLPRMEVKGAIEECKAAGIRIVMVTGDHPETAKTIAQKIGLYENEVPHVVHSNDVPALLKNSEKVQETDVFARVTPEQKLALVELYQDNGFVTAMTGDGINDAPALKKADIGIAMGIRGTEAAKESADLILEDDAFSSIVTAIKQGRGIYSNIRHFVVYLLSCNMSELLVVTIMSLTKIAVPLLPLQILYLNMVTDVFPALALGMNREGDDVMNQPPKSPDEPIITNKMWTAIGVYAIGLSVAVIGVSYFSSYYLSTDLNLTNNIVFYTLMLAQLWHVFNLPGRKVSFFNNVVTKNFYIWIAIILCIILMAISYQIGPVAKVLHLEPISLIHIGVATAFSFIPVLIIQVLKRTGLIL